MRTSCPASRAAAATSSRPSGSSVRKMRVYINALGWIASNLIAYSSRPRSLHLGLGLPASASQSFALPRSPAADWPSGGFLFVAGSDLRRQLCARRSTQPDRDGRSEPLLALDQQMAEVAVDDVLHDGEAQPRPAYGARAAPIHAVEAFGQPRKVRARNARPVVGAPSTGHPGRRGPAARRLGGRGGQPHAPPGRPYFTALSSRFCSTWVSWSASPVTGSGPSGTRISRSLAFSLQPRLEPGREPRQQRRQIDDIGRRAGARSARCATGSAGRRSAGSSARPARP